MPGFPTRTGRSGYGPDPINRRPVTDPRKELDGETIGRLLFWQVGAVGMCLPSAWATFQVNGTALLLVSHAEAFQPRGGSGPTLERLSDGVWNFSYAATYPDETGTQQPLVLSAGLPFAMGPTYLHGQVTINADHHSGVIRFWDTSIAGADPLQSFVVFW
jgi:hypothetical protein